MLLGIYIGAMTALLVAGWAVTHEHAVGLDDWRDEG